ncbi:MAG TPA: hypothetical protein VF230_13450 [Acidimicrobiales bacterium]
MSALVADGMPEEGLFLPFVDAGFAACLPMAGPCGDEDSPLRLLPAAEYGVRWVEPAADSPLPPQTSVKGAPALDPVGTPPPDPSSVNFSLTVLDLVANGQLRSLARAVDGAGELSAPTSDLAAVVATYEGEAFSTGERSFVAATPFGEPYRLETEGLAAADSTPVVPVFVSQQPRVLYGIRPAVAWDIGVELIPLFGGGGVPHLVRTAGGVVGLLVPIPGGADVDDAPAVRARPTANAVDARGEGAGDGGGVSVLAVVLVVLAAAALASAAMLYITRRATPGSS